MPTVTLTDRFVTTLPPPARRVEYHDGGCRGLVLRVTPSGVKTWTLRYRTEAGSTQRLTLGIYPDLGLKGARREADIHRGTVADGDDPAAAKRSTRTMATTAGDTVADLAKSYLTKHAKTFKKSWREDDRMLEVEILPVWKSRKVADLTRRDVRGLVETIAERGSPIMANRVLALVRKMLNFAIQQDWIDANVASLIQKPGTERSRDRVLTDDELRRVWAACEVERPAMAALMKLRLVTAQRGGELAQIRWSDLDGEWLTLRPETTKNKQAHRVYLTPTALALINAVPQVSATLVFPGRFDTRPLGDEKKAGRRIAKRITDALRKQDPTATFDFRGHDLRRTAATRMAAAGVSQTDIARVLNHVEGGPRATQVYNRYDGDREKRIALETWGRVLTAILDAAPTSAIVVPFARA